MYSDMLQMQEISHIYPTEQKPDLFSFSFCVFRFLEGKTNSLLKFQPFLVSGFGVIAIDNKKSKTINLYSAYTEKKLTGARLIDHNSQVQWTMELRLVPFYPS